MGAFAPAYGGDTWAEAIAFLLADPGEAELVGTLRAELEAGSGLFAEPIVVNADEADLDGRVTLANGMHRVTAAWLAGRDRVRCCTSHPDSRPEDEFVEVKFSLDLPSATVEPGDDSVLVDGADYAQTWLRSFRLTDELWVEHSGCLYVVGGVIEAQWYCPHAHAETLVRALARRCARHEVGFTRHEIALTTDAELDEPAMVDG